MNTLQLTQKFISIPSYVDGKCNEKEVADYLWDYLKENLPWLKLTKQKISNSRYNIIAQGSKDPKLIFVCHMDTVLPAGDTKLALRPRLKGNRLYGLGSCDMKGGLAATIIAMQEAGPTESTTLILDCDEEYYFEGMKAILNEFKFRPELAVFPEPTNLKIINGCRGLIEIQLDVIGKTAHAGRPQEGINAIEQAVDLVRRLRLELTKGDAKQLSRTTVNLSALNGARLRDGKVTIQANAVPDIARITLDIRIADTKLDAKKVVRQIKSLAKDLKVKIENIKIKLDYKSYYSDQEELKLLETAVKSCGNKLKYDRDIGKRGFFESALIATKWNCPAVNFGPSPSNMAHKPDEYVDVRSLEKSKEIFTELIRNFEI